MSYYCLPCMLGQILTRMKLTAFGSPATPQSWRPYSVLQVVGIAFLGINLFTLYFVSLAVGKEDNDDGALLGWFAFVNYVVPFLLGIYLLIVIIRTRQHIRETYGIPQQCCGGMEDCCCAYWCGFCTVAQMARHTADYRTYHATWCCSDTGLGENAPPTLDSSIV